MDKRILIAIVLVALALTFIGSGAFVLSSFPPDKYYSHGYTVPQNVTRNSPILFTVKLSEIAPSSTESFTYFNARSIKVKIDGQEYADYALYPNFGGLVNSPLSVSTALPNIGAICCFNTCGGACSICSDQDRNGAQGDRAYIYGKELPQGESLKGTDLFTIAIPEGLAAGTHTVEVYYFSETMGNKYWKSCGITYGMELSGNQYGNQNGKYNYVKSFDVEVVDANAVTPPVTPPVEPPTIPPLSPSITSGIMLLAVIAGAYFVYNLYIKKK